MQSMSSWCSSVSTPPASVWYAGHTCQRAYNGPVAIPQQTMVVLGPTMAPETVREVIRQAAAVHSGTHWLRWRYFDVIYEGVTDHRNVLLPTALWHLLKRNDVDQTWSPGTTLEQLGIGARATSEDPGTEMYVYGYYRTDPPRPQ